MFGRRNIVNGYNIGFWVVQNRKNAVGTYTLCDISTAKRKRRRKRKGGVYRY